jgi:hypothetical protein
MKNGSVDGSKLWLRWGCSSNLRKKRWTLVLEMPVSAASPRTLQRGAPSSGRWCSVMLSSSAMRSSSIERFLVYLASSSALAPVQAFLQHVVDPAHLIGGRGSVASPGSIVKVWSSVYHGVCSAGSAG